MLRGKSPKHSIKSPVRLAGLLQELQPAKPSATPSPKPTQVTQRRAGDTGAGTVASRRKSSVKTGSTRSSQPVAGQVVRQGTIALAQEQHVVLAVADGGEDMDDGDGSSAVDNSACFNGGDGGKSGSQIRESRRRESVRDAVPVSPSITPHSGMESALTEPPMADSGGAPDVDPDQEHDHNPVNVQEQGGIIIPTSPSHTPTTVQPDGESRGPSLSVGASESVPLDENSRQGVDTDSASAGSEEEEEEEEDAEAVAARCRVSVCEAVAPLSRGNTQVDVFRGATASVSPTHNMKDVATPRPRGYTSVSDGSGVEDLARVRTPSVPSATSTPRSFKERLKRLFGGGGSKSTASLPTPSPPLPASPTMSAAGARDPSPLLPAKPGKKQRAEPAEVGVHLPVIVPAPAVVDSPAPRPKHRVSIVDSPTFFNSTPVPVPSGDRVRRPSSGASLSAAGPSGSETRGLAVIIPSAAAPAGAKGASTIPMTPIRPARTSATPLSNTTAAGLSHSLSAACASPRAQRGIRKSSIKLPSSGSEAAPVAAQPPTQSAAVGSSGTRSHDTLPASAGRRESKASSVTKPSAASTLAKPPDSEDSVNLAPLLFTEMTTLSQAYVETLARLKSVNVSAVPYVVVQGVKQHLQLFTSSVLMAERTLAAHPIVRQGTTEADALLQFLNVARTSLFSIHSTLALLKKPHRDRDRDDASSISSRGSGSRSDHSYRHSLSPSHSRSRIRQGPVPGDDESDRMTRRSRATHRSKQRSKFNRTPSPVSFKARQDD